MSVPYAWTVVATVPENPEDMPPSPYRWRTQFAWQTSSSSWMHRGLEKTYDGQRWVLTAGQQSAKTWQNQTTAKAQATVARNCGFEVEIIPLYADETDLQALVASQKDRIADLEAEIYNLKIESAKDRIYITQLEASVRDRVAVENHSI